VLEQKARTGPERGADFSRVNAENGASLGRQALTEKHQSQTNVPHLLLKATMVTVVDWKWPTPTSPTMRPVSRCGSLCGAIHPAKAVSCEGQTHSRVGFPGRRKSGVSWQRRQPGERCRCLVGLWPGAFEPPAQRPCFFRATAAPPPLPPKTANLQSRRRGPVGSHVLTRRDLLCAWKAQSAFRALI